VGFRENKTALPPSTPQRTQHVPMMENNVPEAIQNNVLGTKITADLAVKHGTGKFVMVSTDKAVNPTNIMGCSKRICEIYVQSLSRQVSAGTGGTQFITTRFGNVLRFERLGNPAFQEQIRRGGPVTVTHPEIIRYFMTIPRLANSCWEAGAMGGGRRDLHFRYGKSREDIGAGEKDDYPVGREAREDRVHGAAARRKAVRRAVERYGARAATSHDKIMIANVREYDFDVVAKEVDELIALSLTADDRRIVAKMKAIVPRVSKYHTPLFEGI